MNNLDQLESTFYELVHEGQLKVVETETEGEAELKINTKNRAISFVIKAGNGFSYLAIKNTPDGIIFEEKPDKSWVLHVFECKKTVTEKAWNKAKKQFAGGILHAHMLRGLLDLPDFTEIKVYTVYRESKLLAKSADTGLYRQPVGMKVNRLPYQDWKQDKVEVLNNLSVSHEKIVLNPDGIGEFVLGSN